MSTVEPRTTSFAVLGLLAIRPFTPYELSKQFPRSLGRFWPRARSKLYEIPKRLVDQGLARASVRRTGRRERTEYAITPKGRRALAAWLATPGEPPQLEFEQLIKVFFADQADTDAARVNLEAARAWARERHENNLDTGRRYLAGAGAFQERAALLVISGAFMTRFALMVDEWATWALEVIADWPDDPSEAPVDTEAQRALEREILAALER